MILMVVFGVKGEDAGSTRDAVRRALHREKVEEVKEAASLSHTDDGTTPKRIQAGE